MTTKTKILVISMLLFNNIIATAQNDSVKIKREYVAYTLFYNVVPDQFNYPLVGFVNIAKGNHKGLQIGFINTTFKDFKGLQIGFVNSTFGNLSGVKLGFVNTTLKNAKGFQAGFVNTTLGNFSGVKLGFLNTTLRNSEGFQAGFVNTTLGNFSGVKLGFVNTTLGNTNGFQLGFVNFARKGIKGSQIGFINMADTISNGVPIGFLSFVKKGGYRAIEMSLNELYPLNLTFKIGVPRFYSFVQGSYNHNYNEPFGLGLGFGSLIPLGKNFYFNPEIGNLQSVSKISNANTSILAANVRYSFNSKLQLAAGLSAVWLNYPEGENRLNPPFFSFVNREINSRNRILAGARIALSFNFTDL